MAAVVARERAIIDGGAQTRMAILRGLMQGQNLCGLMWGFTVIRNGRVTGVQEDRIDLVELVPDGAGGWLERPASVALEDN